MMRKNRDEPDFRVPLFLSNEERKLILAEANLTEEIKNQLAFAEVKGDGLVVYLPLYDLEDLFEAAAIEDDRCKDETKQNLWEQVLEKIHAIFKDCDGGYDPQESIDEFLSHFPPEVAQRLKTVIQSGQTNNLDELNAAIAELMNEFNQQPQTDMGGLSPEQVANLIYCDWNDPNGTIRFNPGLTLKDLDQSKHLVNARTMLAAIEDETKVKATSSNNLNRKFVNRMVEALSFKEGFVGDLHRYNKVINERDVQPLHIVRVLSELAGLLKRRKNEFSLTRKGKQYLKEEKAGELFLLLFKTHYLKFDLAYLDRSPENEVLQQTIAYSFYMVRKHLKNWRSVENDAELILLPAAYEEALPYGFGDYPKYQTSTRIIYPLEHFGLLQSRDKKDDNSHFPNQEYKQTPLFDKFIQFKLE